MTESRPPNPVPSWARVKERLQGAQEAVSALVGTDEQLAEATLTERARKLARPLEATRDAPTLDVVRFELASEMHAIETRFVLEVTPLPAWTRLPGAPARLLGVANFRGQLLPVFDAHVLLGATPPPRGPAWRLLVVGVERPEFGLVVEAVLEVRAVETDSIGAPPDAGNSTAGLPLRGLTADPMAVIDGEALLADERLWPGAAPPPQLSARTRP